MSVWPPPDIVSLHLALTPETRGMIDRRRIGLLRPGAVLVNTARGDLIDQAALLDRLRIGDIAAGLDVFAEEPLPTGHPLLGLDNVTLTPHVAWNTGAAAAASAARRSAGVGARRRSGFIRSAPRRPCRDTAACRSDRAP